MAGLFSFFSGLFFRKQTPTNAPDAPRVVGAPFPTGPDVFYLLVRLDQPPGISSLSEDETASETESPHTILGAYPDLEEVQRQANAASVLDLQAQWTNPKFRQRFASELEGFLYPPHYELETDPPMPIRVYNDVPWERLKAHGLDVQGELPGDLTDAQALDLLDVFPGLRTHWIHAVRAAKETAP